MSELKKLYWRRSTVLPETYRRIMYRKFRRPGQVIQRGAARYRIHDHSDVIGESIYVYGTCAKYVSTLLESAQPFFKTFIDVGANIGSVTIPFAKGFSGQILSIEPSASNYALLIENLRLNGLDHGQVRSYRQAIGDRPGRLELYRSATNCGDHRLATASTEKRETETVEVVTLDSLVIGNEEFHPPYLIKIDVQGYEARVLSSASVLLKHPCLIVAEFWPYGLHLSGTTADQFDSLVDAAHLDVYEVAEDRLAIRRRGLAAIQNELSAERFEDSRDIVLTNMPLSATGLDKFVTS